MNIKNTNKNLQAHPMVGLVVPTIRENSIKRFFDEWEEEFASYPNLKIFLIEDNPTKSFNLSTDLDIQHFSWEDIDRELGTNSWIIPRRTDCVRSYGYYKAYKAGVDIMITLDDDCYPVGKQPYLIKSFIENLERRVSTSWMNTLGGRLANHKNFYPRGFPYEGRDKSVVLSHGLWNNVPDFDGQTQLQHPVVRVSIVGHEANVVPRGIFYPMCGMNVAVKREVIPAFYFLLMGMDYKNNPWKFHRFGDIWAGIFSKKIIDHLDKAVVTGNPLIYHDRASDPQKNVELEKHGIIENEFLAKKVAAITLTKNTFKDCYRELGEKLPYTDEHFVSIKKAMIAWSDLF